MSLRDLPSVDRLLQAPHAQELLQRYGHDALTDAVRESLETARAEIKSGQQAPSEAELLVTVEELLSGWTASTLQPVINASGVILHTNLGRAPLSQAAQRAMVSIAQGYSTLEYDLKAGKRGRRDDHAEALIVRITGAEAALVVNNNASAVLLALIALSRRKEVLISRSQLIEIGGGFRIPEVMKQSGAKIVEVGTTNRTHLDDFRAVIHDRTGLILRAHHSNFRIVGFTTEPTLEELVSLGKEFDVPVLDDIGSGALLDTETFGLGHEPMVQESLQSGAALVAFSGDKLLGGPQAGILVGSNAIIKKLKKHPLARAVRPDKLCLAALTATLIPYLTGKVVEEIPVWHMIAAQETDLKSRAKRWVDQLGHGEVRAGQSTVGGGSLPEETLPTWLVALTLDRPDALVTKLRLGDPAIIARVEDDRVVLDPRTVDPDDDERLLARIRELLSN